jgi:hypothetical protein
MYILERPDMGIVDLIILRSSQQRSPCATTLTVFL